MIELVDWYSTRVMEKHALLSKFEYPLCQHLRSVADTVVGTRIKLLQRTLKPSRVR